MSKIHIMYMTPTMKEAMRIGRMAKRLHRELSSSDRCVIVSPLTYERAVFREPWHGKPRVEVHWIIGTMNLALAQDDRAWNRAIELYDTRPYWIAWLQSVWEARFGRKETE